MTDDQERTPCGCHGRLDCWMAATGEGTGADAHRVTMVTGGWPDMEPTYRCLCGVTLVGLRCVEYHRMVAEIDHLRGENEALRSALADLREA